jgi:hypothetical protein
VGQRLRSFFSKPRGADLVVLKELLEAGKVTPVIDEPSRWLRRLKRSGMSASGPPKANRHHRVSRPLRRAMEKENEHGEGPHRACGLARWVYQWAKRRP